MPDVVIQRCTLRVVRRGGWSWGADPKRLVRDAIDAIPILIAERLAELLKERLGDLEVTQPIRIRVPVRLDELHTDRRLGSTMTTRGRLRWSREIDDALREALSGLETAVDTPAEPNATEVTRTRRQLASVERVLGEALVAWRRTGLLAFLVAIVPGETLQHWMRILAVAHPDIAEPANPVVVGPRASRDSASIPGTNVSDDTSLAAELLAMADRLSSVTATEKSGGGSVRSEDSASVAGHARASAPNAHGRYRPRSSDEASMGARTAEAAMAARKVPPPSTSRAIVDADATVPSALPWLLLVPLDRFGYLRVLRASLAVADVMDRGFVFGAALALKLTGMGDRAWQKTSDAEHLAMVMAARQRAVSANELHQFAHRFASHGMLTDAQIAHSVCAGRTKHQPWLLARVRPQSFALIDPEGLFPAWWGLDAAASVAALQSVGPSEVVVVDEEPDAKLCRLLAIQRIPFATRSRPGRDESWSRVASTDWWSNEPRSFSGPARRLIAGTDDGLDRARALCEEFGSRRIARPLDPDDRFEHSLSLAASVALGTIAWELWHTRESTDPLLALERLGDLDARVRFTQRSVRVIVPLGRRHRDLLDAGLLADVHDVPWLDGRTLEFSGG